MLLITGSSDEDPEQERELIRELLERRVDGLIVAPAAADHRYLLPDIAHGVAVVFIDRPPGSIEADTILFDNAGGVRAAVEHLLELGHERIGFIGDLPRPPTAMPTGNNRITIGALTELARGDDALALVGFDDLELAGLLARPLTAVAYDAEELGRRAATLAVRRLDGDDGPPEQLIEPTSLVVRASSGG
jgi:LacI family transcriptional regulator